MKPAVGGDYMNSKLKFRSLRFSSSLALIMIPTLVGGTGWAQDSAATEEESAVTSVEVNPAELSAEAGQVLTFTAVAKDEAGNALDEEPSIWFAAPWDLAAMEDGTVTLHRAGKVRVGAVIGGKTGYATIDVKPAAIAAIDLDPPDSPVVVGGEAKLEATARDSRGDPREDVVFVWNAEAPSIATIDEGGIVSGVSPGRATFSASAEGTLGRVSVDIVAGRVASLSIAPRSSKVRTGDVVRFVATAVDSGGAPVDDPAVRWAVSGQGATIEEDGAFVAERAGVFPVFGISGTAVASVSVIVTPRNAERELELVGRVLNNEFQTAEQWIFDDYAYLASIADKVQVFDVTDPSAPKQTDTITVDARLINDVSVTPDGKIGVLTREGASSRKNGIVFLDTADPAHPQILSEYTETVSGGVHSAFIDGHYVYLTDDATGSLRIIDFEDVHAPREVARWQVESPTAKTIVMKTPEGEHRVSSGRYLHDVYVKDGLAYLAYWRDGLVILDVGRGVKGGSPVKPQFVSQLRFNYHELYGNDWLAGAHAVFRYKDYVFLADEVFPAQFDLSSKNRFPVRGIAFVVDVSDIEGPAQGRGIQRSRGRCSQYLGRRRHYVYGLLQRWG